MGDVVLTPDRPVGKKRRRGLIVALAVLALTAGFIVWAGLNIYSNGRTERIAAAKEALFNLKESYGEFVYEYGDIGYEPYESMLVAINGPSFFLVTESEIIENEKALGNAELALEDLDGDSLKLILDETLRDFYDDAEMKMSAVLDAASYNIDVLRRFYDVFAAPAYRLINGEDAPKRECSILYDDSVFKDDSILLEVAVQYQKAYCLVNEVLYDSGDLEKMNNLEIIAAKANLASILVGVEGSDGYDELITVVSGVENAE